MVAFWVRRREGDLDRARSLPRVARDALSSTLIACAGSGMGAWSVLSARLAQGENVRAALAFVAKGEAPLGVVYATDALAEPKVRVVAVFPDTMHAPIVYPAAAMAQGDSAAASKDFRAYLRSVRARAIFKRAGFDTP